MTLNTILGLDPGLGTFGHALLRRSNNIRKRLVTCGLFETSKDTRYSYYEDFHRRCRELYPHIMRLLDEHEPDALAVEAFSYPRQARAATFLASSHMAIIAACEERDIPLIQVQRSFVLGAVGCDVRHVRGRRAKRAAIKKHVIDWCFEYWPKAPWPKQKAKQEHPCDAAAAANAVLESRAHQARLSARRDVQQGRGQPKIVTSFDILSA